MCFAEIECPLPPTISPRPTRSPVKGFDIGKHDKEIIGYYASWQWYDRSKLAKPENMDFRKVTRVNFAFFQIDTAGNIWGTDDWAGMFICTSDLLVFV
jgi:GH18 family chitinase